MRQRQGTDSSTGGTLKRSVGMIVLIAMLSLNCVPTKAQTVKLDVAVVTLVSGPVRVRADNQAERVLKPFGRVRMDDQIVVPSASKLKIIYLENGRAELWSGAAQFRAGNSASDAQAGSPEVTNSAVAVRQVLARAPDFSRMSALGGSTIRGRQAPQRQENITLAEIRETYIKLRKELPDTDLTPELFLMSATAEYISSISDSAPR